MSMWQLFATILAVLVVLLLAVVAIGAWRVLGMRRRHRRLVAAHAPEHSAPGVLFGIASQRERQQRGPGTLVVGPQTLAFVQLVPEREVVVPRDAITSVTSSPTFLGKTRGKPLLVITWQENGMGDALAVDVADVAAWRERLGTPGPGTTD